jgi:glycosyltransferase involved in cell wall biosynthesis
VFPSLYEGFGMPILEAMAFGKPVICSNVTSLPEVAGDAAIYIDPRKPLDIVHAIELITSDATAIEDLIDQGYQRLTAFRGPERMARQYLDIFLEVMRKG